LAGYLHPHSGSISVCSNILADTALRTYYPHIGYLSQDPGVFDATIRENLLSSLQDTDSRNEDIENVLKNALDMAQCQFVYDLEK
jgi:ATP-binding cassette subfamily B protein